MLFTTANERLTNSKSDFSLLDRFDVDPGVELSHSVNVPLPLKTRRNGTLFLHIFLTKKSHGNDWSSALNDQTTTYAAAQVTQYQVPVQQTFNLLRDEVSPFSHKNMHSKK